MKRLNLKKDSKEAKNELQIYAKQVCGIFQLWHIFSSAKVMCDAFARDLNKVSYETLMAYTKAIVVEYSKPWTGNQSKYLNSLLLEKDYPFLALEIKKSIHSELLELRDKMIAHIDNGYESYELTIRGRTIQNFNPHLENNKQDGTLDEVFFPLTIRVEGTGPMWWIKNSKKVIEIQKHLENCINVTGDYLILCTTQLRNFTFNHLHVLKDIPEIFKIEEIESKKGESGKIEIEHKVWIESGSTFSLKPSKNIKIGKANLQGTIGAFEPKPNLPLDVDVKGKGYRLTISNNNENGKVDFNIQFPKYPYPKEKLNKK